MKNKSGHHKETNRFKFTTFADRVNAIDVRRSALYHVEHVNIDVPEINETYFHNTLLRWKVLNLTNEYIKFTKTAENIVTLPQLLHKKDEIIQHVWEQLESGDALNLQPFLEILVALARDLQEEFYKYFPKFFDSLIKLLNTKDPEQLEWTLICLAFLFKHLRKYLRRDITVVLKSVLSLLSESSKWYIKNFAAESFAFVARDVKDKKLFLETIINSVQANEDLVEGCGHLLFEVIRGVGGQYHSCSTEFFSTFFNTLQNKNVNQKLLFDILTQTVGDMLEVTDPKASKIFWDVVIENITFIFKTDLTSEKSKWVMKQENVALEYMLRLIGQCLEYKGGRFLADSLPIINLMNNLASANLSENNLKIVSQIGVLLLLCSHITLPHEHAVYLTKNLLSIPHISIVTNFVKEVVLCSSFDMIVFPHFIDTIVDFNEEIIDVLSKICLKKSPLCQNGSDLYSWVKYPIDFGNKVADFNKLIDVLLDDSIESILNSWDNYINILICLPHIKNLNLINLKAKFERLIALLILYLKNVDNNLANHNKICNILFFMAVMLESAIHTISFENIEKMYNVDELLNVLEPFISQDSYICSLRILDLLFTVKENEHALTYEVFLKVYPMVENKLTSCFHEHRLLATHICSLFEITIPDVCGFKSKKNNVDSISEESDQNSSFNKKESFKMFSLCYAAENLPLSVETYREQLLKLSKTVYDSVQFKFAKDTPFKNFSLKYLFGFLHVNFKLLWEPTQKFILTYGNGVTPIDFWEVFYPCFSQATENIRNGTKTLNVPTTYNGKSDLIQSLFNNYCVVNEVIDYSIYRIHLLEILSHASNLCEVKNRDLTTLFIEFMNIEYENKTLSSDGNPLEMETDDIVDDDNDTSMSEANDKEENVKVSVNRMTYDTLIAYLKIYANIHNPKALHKEEYLKKVYYDFLMHKNPVIQKVALDCVMTYKNKHIIPYKDHLYNLVDGKKFKEELRVFKVAEDNDMIKQEDREDLMPVVLRIVFSKMITNVGIDKKGGSQMRRSLVIRFLAGCEEKELLIFINMAFQVYTSYIDLDLDKMYETIVSSSTLPNMGSPKLLLGSINLVETMRAQLIKPGEVQVLPKLLKIIFCIGTFVDKVLKEQDDSKSGYLSILKNVRNLCLQSLANFFQQFYEWNWTENEILYIYKVFVWPLVGKLSKEGIHSPTALLKLFNIWSQYPRYHNIFSIYRENEEHTPLYYILELLSHEKINHSVNDMCMQIIERLLTLEHTEDDFVSFTKCNMISLNIIESTKKLNLIENLNIGSCIILPCIPSLMNVLKAKFENVNPKKLTKRDVNIISRLTDIISDMNSVDVFLKFSLPILIKRIGTSDSNENFDICIDALTKLLKKTTNPKSHIKTIIPLFSKVNTAHARKQLCESIKILASNDDSSEKEILTTAVEVVTEMNASDEKWIEQPDFTRRLAIYKKIYEMFESNTINVDLASLIVHNCFYTITHSNDLSLRSSASTCLQKIVPGLLLKFKDDDFFVNNTLIFLIKNGLKSENENLKIETISLLGELVRESPDGYLSFSELQPLSNKKDKEVDFFENLIHLQIHRKTRAFLKFCNYARTSSKVPSAKTLTLFIMPLASQYVCNEKFVEKYSLVEAAVETIGVICRLLPWHQYEMVLKHYLGKLHRSSDHQKQLIKLISTILDSFHFDLTKAKNIDEIVANAFLKKDQLENSTKISSTDVEMDEDDENIVHSTVKSNIPYETIQVLSPSAAKRVIYVITSDILIQLDWSSSQALGHEATHKSLKKEINIARETDEKLRLPLGFAIVKLLQKLPPPMLSNNLSSIIIKVCNFLKSPLVNIRASARDVISKIMITVGTSYFNMLMNHLTTLLTKGFQVHVLISTVHTVLQELKDKFSPGEMDKYFDNIIKVCLNDLFGHASEEKEVVKLGNKAPEAKPSKKCYLTLRIIAQNISDSSIVRLLSPFKSILEKTHSKRVVMKIETAFQYISLGLVENTGISIESSLIFLCGLLSDSIPKLAQKTKKQKPEITLEEPKPVKSDCFLIPPDPKGSKKMPKIQTAQTSSQANIHVITEFGLNMLHVVLQKEKLHSMDTRPFLDPMIPFILNALKSSQVRIATLGLKCVTSLFVKNFNLPSLKSNINDALDSIFGILHKYSTSGLNKRDENFHLVANAFKATTSLIRSAKYCTFDSQQIKTLLMYVEHDIHDHEKQATAFSLLKAILLAKYNLPEIKDVIKKVAKMTIVDESPRTREESSQVMMLYLLNYPSPKKLKAHIEFYVSQLNYELEHGRISAMKILMGMIDGFTEEIITKHSGFFYLSLGMRLLNESSEECRNNVITCIEKVLLKVNLMKRNELFDLTMSLLSDNEPANIELAAHLFCRFILIEKESFKQRLDNVLPKLSEKLNGSSSNVGRFVKIARKESLIDKNNLVFKDSTYIQLLRLLNVISEICPVVFSDDKYISIIEEIGINVQSLLGYSHLSVRILAGQFISLYIQSLDSNIVYNSMANKMTADRYFLYTEESIKSLTLDLVSQLVPGEVTEELAAAVCKNIIQLLKLISSFPTVDNQIENMEIDEIPLNEIWVVKKLKSAINSELVRNPGITIVRMAVFGVYGDIATFLPIQKLISLSPIMIPSIVRELTKSDPKFEKLKETAHQVGIAIENKLGSSIYNEILGKVQAKLVRKRKERKVKIAQDKVNNPERAAKRKSTLREQKKNYKKRKMDKLKGRMPKHRVAPISNDSMDMD